MQKTHKYRLYPTKAQIKILDSWLELCRWLYNRLLEERRNAWEQEQKSLSYTAQCRRLVELKKEEKPELGRVYSQVLMNVVGRLDNAFQHFFRRVKKGEKPGYPRFKNGNRFHSFTYPQFGFKLEDRRLKLSGIGDIKVKFHRPIDGKIETCTIVRKPTGKWYVCFSIEYTPKPLPENRRVVGIDMGIESFATLSTGEKISNPHFFRKEEKALAKAQRRLSKLKAQGKQGTPVYQKVKKVIARIHERICFKRHNFIHQLSRKLVSRFGVICVEELKVKNMMQNSYLAKSIGEVAWAEFISALSYKAADADKSFVKVKPNNTSQLCSRCHLIVSKDLSARIHSCPYCGLSIDRDLNSAFNILALGLQSLGIESLEAHVL